MKDNSNELFFIPDEEMDEKAQNAAQVIRRFVSSVHDQEHALGEQFFNVDATDKSSFPAKKQEAPQIEGVEELLESAHLLSDDLRQDSLIKTKVQIPSEDGSKPAKVIYLREIGRATKEQLRRARLRQKQELH